MVAAEVVDDSRDLFEEEDQDGEGGDDDDRRTREGGDAGAPELRSPRVTAGHGRGRR
ncbi:hypothetical protein ACF1BE_09930 [Streptomyces sp. NPDC014991]|uniref:hypothetical protein n=1 Tax=Streptomyces sp. NPDC014991 TaxID=3364935 RepID=UPI0036FED0B3